MWKWACQAMKTGTKHSLQDWQGAQYGSDLQEFVGEFYLLYVELKWGVF